MENTIKEQQLDLFSDRTSLTGVAGNQLRLRFSAFASIHLDALRSTARPWPAPPPEPYASSCSGSAWVSPAWKCALLHRALAVAVDGSYRELACCRRCIEY